MPAYCKVYRPRLCKGGCAVAMRSFAKLLWTLGFLYLITVAFHLVLPCEVSSK